jgi:addiction module HigA family antidote
MNDMNNPAHPGELFDAYLDGVSLAEAARRIGVTRATLSRIRHGHASITADMAVRLAELFGTSAELWLDMQTAHDLWVARTKPRPKIDAIVIAKRGRPVVRLVPIDDDADRTGAELARWQTANPAPVGEAPAPDALDEQIAAERGAWR